MARCVLLGWVLGFAAAAPAPVGAQSSTYGEAMAWYGEAAGRGDAEAQYLLAYALETGAQGRTDLVAARDWYAAAAAQGHIRASLRLARMQLEGRGGPVDAVAARAHLEVAAEAGDTDAMSLLGWLIAATHGDRVIAFRWLSLAADAGDGAAAANLAALVNAMSADEVGAAEAALAAWRAARS